MSKKLIRIVITLLGFCLALIIVFQYFWIRNAVKVREDQFGHSVSQALEKVVDRIKMNEVVSFISGKFGNDPAEFDSLLSLYGQNSGVFINSDDSLSSVFRFNSDQPDNDSSRHGNCILQKKFDLNFKNPDSAKMVQIIIYGNQNGNTTDSLLTVHGINSRKQQFMTIMDKLVMEFSISKENKILKYDRDSVRSIIRAELKSQNLPLDCQYAIMTDINKDSYLVESAGFKSEMRNSPYRINLSKDDGLPDPKYLLLFFPSHRGYIYGSMWSVLLCSFLFSLIIISTFSWTIHIILQQKKLSDIKSDFINNMTHEFKTPIATISLAADSIVNPRVIEDPEQVSHFTRIIREENNRMNSSVEHVLQMALFDRKEFGLNPELTDINSLCMKAAGKMSLIVMNRSGKINTELNAVNPNVYADSHHFLNVLMNLLDNAGKYSDNAPEITVSTRNENESVIIDVKDKGIGMKKEEMSKIFDKFYRVSTGNIHKVKGFGLGLSYARLIVGAHNGTITVNSQPGKGSTFRISLPCASIT